MTRPAATLMSLYFVYQEESSTSQEEFLAQIKREISQEAGRDKLTGSDPCNNLQVHPSDPTVARNTVNVGDHHLRFVFVWVLEQTHPRGLPEERPPCPRYKTARYVVIKGWTQKLTRRAVLPVSVATSCWTTPNNAGTAERTRGSLRWVVFQLAS